MEYLKILAVGLVACIHIYIFYLEVFLWTTKKGIAAFGLKSKEFAVETRVMAANQGLYNLFLAAGIIWSLIYNKEHTVLFFLTCVFIAGIYGAYSTKNLRIIYIQSLPAIIAIALTLFL